VQREAHGLIPDDIIEVREASEGHASHRLHGTIIVN